MSVDQSLESERKEDIKDVETRRPCMWIIGSPFDELEDLDENIYFRIKLISTLEEIKKLTTTNQKLEIEISAMKHDLQMAND